MREVSDIDVLIIMGSKSDEEVASNAISLLKYFKISYEVRIASAHRTPNKIKEIIECVENRGCKVIIAIAGMSAALPGVIASKTYLPVIGVPVPGSSLGQGMDALLSIVQMPRGVPVGCMSIGNSGACNAALYAVRILALRDSELKARLNLWKVFQAMGIDRDDREILEKYSNEEE